MIKIYGPPRSSAGRCYFLLEELGLSYEQVPLDMMEKKEHKSEAFLKLNPNGKVPCLVDADFVIWESLAINNYLAEKYKPELLGANAQEKGLVQQWSIWALLELQPPMVDILIQTLFTPEHKRDANLIAQAKEKIPPKLEILNRYLLNKNFVVGEKFTLADLNVASVVNIASGLQIPLKDYPNLSAWFTKIKTRPSFEKLLSMRK